MSMLAAEPAPAGQKQNLSSSIQAEYQNCVSAVKQLSQFIDSLEASGLAEAEQANKPDRKPFVATVRDLPAELAGLCEAIHTQRNRLREMLT